ncbi:MAG: PSD1 and planctomycete cytochrome C domain-containing protein [Planctomycetaceae bacterium]|nr:PSD1 and planctomycete cytochrome C domain-containing protein [Planctomycetaceae bacterium]
MIRRFAIALALVVPPSSVALAADEDDGLRLFRERIEPVLKTECFGCHSGAAKELKGGLRLDSRQAARRGGETGAAVVPGKPAQSLIVQALRHEGGYEMPPDKPKLADSVVADFVKWIELGAPDPRDQAAPLAETWPNQAREHWAFLPIKAPTIGRGSGSAGASPSRAIDTFIVEKLSQRGWELSPAASRTELIRRLAFDLIGLPPTPEEIADFAAATEPDAYERLVDRLMASPLFGQKQAQHWLDVVRYAETEGYEYDRHVPDAWRYRDYTIDAFNRDKPFDRFVREQIAGDELDPGDPECLTATVFHRLGPVRRNAGNPDIALSRNEVLTERTDIIGTAILGLTVGCARCHNHKLEPISQRDYYRLQAYLAATDEHNVSLAPPDEQAAWDAETRRIKDQMEAIKKVARTKTGEERVKMQEMIDALEETLPLPLATIPSTWNDFSARTPIHVLRRGIWESKLDAVGPRPPSVLVSAELPELAADVSNPRTQLADWLTDSKNPLVARVIVNRLWQQHFGTGIVKTANDFGLRGERPSHPELLDHLAASLVENDWSLKTIHRRIVSSSTYRQSSSFRTPHSALRTSSDPDNRLLWRFNRRRLSAEELRDAMLAASGRLNLQAGGPSVMTPVDPELVNLLYKPSQWQVPQAAAQQDRRSVFLIAKRNLRLPFMEAFDGPALLTSCARRESSTHAPQALELLNGAISNELAGAFAERVAGTLRVPSAANGTRSVPTTLIIQRAFLLALGRHPTPRELAASVDFLKDGPLEEFCLALFNLNDFAHVP